MNTYYLTSKDYINLTNVSFLSEAPTNIVQEVLNIQGFKTTLTELMTELIDRGYETLNNKK